MPYVRRTWQNAPSSATPLNAAALNNIEDGVEEAVEAVTGRLSEATLESTIGSVAAAEVANPETDLSNAVQLLIAAGSIPGIVTVDFSADANTARPDAPVVYWEALQGSAGEDGPFQMQDGDRRYIYLDEPAPVPFTPQELAGLFAWYDAQQAAGTNGVGLAQWDDESASGGHHMTQGTGANQPVFTTGAINTRPALRFDGVSDRYAVNITSYTGVWTVYLVAQAVPASITSTSDFLLDGKDSTNATLKLGYSRTVAGFWEANRGTALAGPAADNAPHIHRVVFDATTSVTIDGGTPVTGSSGTAGEVVQLVLGARADLTRFFDGYIGEVILIKGTVTTDENTDVMAYLTAKWGF